eukprot:gene21990-34181_t
MPPTVMEGSISHPSTQAGMALETVLPWPDKLPEFVGMKFIEKEKDPKWGTGMEVRRQLMREYEFHPDREKYPDLFRAKFVGELLQIPGDATIEAQLSEGTHYTQLRYFRVDKSMKCMRLVGAMDVPSETTDPNVLTWGWAPLSEKHGTWQWHMIDVMDLQFELNANNTVMRSCNFKDKKVMETGDISANMSFFLAREDEHGGSSVAPGFHPHRVDRTVEWHDEMQRLFDEKNVFRRSHEKPINVMFTARFTE